MRIEGASHPYEVSLDLESGRVEFIFDNILLPDSTTNEIESQGFIKYRINHKEDLVNNTFIENTASIYFDSNPPIVTNTVYNICLLYTSPSPRDQRGSRMPSSA